MDRYQELNIDEFVDLSKRNLENFALWWCKNASEGEDFPSHLLVGDWEDQFQLFLDQDRTK